MSDVTQGEHRRRILLAVDTSPLALKAVELAIEMADDLEHELEGAFYEDVQLLKLSSLPFIRESGYTSTSGRALNPSAMRRRLRAKADEIRRFLARECSARNLPWSLTVLQEPPAHQVLEAAAAADVSVIGLESRQPRATVPGTESRRVADSVVVLFESSHAGHRALTTAVRASQRGSRLVVLPVDDSEDAVRALSDPAMLAAPITVELFQEYVTSITDVVDVVRSERCETLIAPRDLRFAEHASIQALIDELDCLLMLVR